MNGVSGIASRKYSLFSRSSVANGETLLSRLPHCSTLWSMFAAQFHLISTEVASKPGLVEGFIDRWLARAGGCPLSLTFIGIDDSALSLIRLRDIIHRYSHQLQYLELNMASSEMHELGFDSGVFPLLERVELYDNEDDPPQHPLAQLFVNAPRLHDVSMRYGRNSVTRFSFPWLQLTKFEGLIESLNVLIMAPNLIEIKGNLIEEAEHPFAIITHPRVNSLTVTRISPFLDDDSDLEIIKYLTLPALKYLDVSEMCSYTSFEPFLIRSSPPLVSVSVRSDFSDFNRLPLPWARPLLRVTSTLENLEIINISEFIMPDLLEELFKKILTLSLRVSWGSVELHRLIQFLYKRPDNLRSFRLVWNVDPFLENILSAGPQAAEVEDTVKGHLSRMARAGLNIYLGTENKNYVDDGNLEGRQ
ncbi:hypothetical protein B0H19DRAFT_1376096 [Mycena capillaripes]|nr:hypothetical protein B0H19DRAFT_1376096 [Mycena capillaripes]